MKTTKALLLKATANSVGTIPSLSPMSLGPTVYEAGTGGNGPLQTASNRTLVVIQLMGGNDGINTIVPYGQQAYNSVRPTLALKQNEMLQVDGDIALNGLMSGVMNLFKSNKAAIVQGVSYPNPNRSHFEATAIWESASPDSPLSNGWLGRYLDIVRPVDPSINAVSLGNLLPPTLQGANQRALSVGNLNRFKVSQIGTNAAKSDVEMIKMIDEVQCTSCQEYTSIVKQMMQSGIDAISASSIISQAANHYQTSVNYPTNDFANRLKLAAAIVSSSMKPRIIYLQLGGFDTHANQKATQNRLLQTLSDGIAAFYSDMEAQGRANDTMIMTFTEFGRRVKENGNRGTDHGTAEPQLIVGGKISGGLYGTYPSLTDLDKGDLKFNIDFRQVYASVLEDWLGIDQSSVLSSKFDKVSVVQ